jgi:hypothetical protein
VEASGRGIGDEVVLVDPFHLIEQKLTIVGTSVMPVDFTFGAGSPLAFPTPAFTRRWSTELRAIERQGGRDVLGGAVLVRGRQGSDSERLAARVVRASDPGEIAGVNTVASKSALVVDTLEFQRDG